MTEAVPTFVKNKQKINESLLAHSRAEARLFGQLYVIKSKKARREFWTKEIKSLITELDDCKFGSVTHWLSELLDDDEALADKCAYLGTILFLYSLDEPKIFKLSRPHPFID